MNDFVVKCGLLLAEGLFLRDLQKLAPIIGYDNAANIAHIASETGESIFEVAIKETDLSKEELEKILDPEAMTEPKK